MIAFGENPLWFQILDIIASATFFTDILLCLNTAVYDQTHVIITDRHQIARIYAKTYLVFDLVSLLPIHMIFDWSWW
jgi:hypothetical protein